jgi:hypothetical protein
MNDTEETVEAQLRLAMERIETLAKANQQLQIQVIRHEAVANAYRQLIVDMILPKV